MQRRTPRRPPAGTLRRLPAGTLRRLPAGTLRRLPAGTLRRVLAGLAPVLAVALLATACGDDQPVSPLGEQGADPVVPSASASAPASAEPPGPGEAGALPGFTPRSVAYLHADITVTEAEISQQPPSSYGETGGSGSGDTTYLYLSVTVANRLNHTGLLVQDGIFLDPGNGELVEHTGRTEAVRNISAGATATGWYGFALPDGATPAAPVLVLGPPGHRQERLPLTGEVPEPKYPMPIEVASPGTIEVGRRGCPLEVEVTEAYLAHWVGFDSGSRSYSTRQAAADRLMLYLGVAVTAPPGSGGCFIGTASGGDVHLVVDGERRGDIPQLNSTTNVSEGSTAHQYLVYDIPEAGQVEIEWGRLGGPQQRIPVPVP